MKILILSDIHLEFESYDYEIPPNDLTILAGDIFNATFSSSDRSNFFAEFEKVSTNGIICIEGNHEGYRGSVNSFDRINRNNFTKIIKGIRFICSTGWAYPTQDAWRRINDSTIAGFTLDIMREYHHNDWKYIEDELKKDFKGKTIVVTHHLPVEESIHQDYKGSSINSAFCSYKSEIIEEYSPEVWVHGHTHSSFDYIFKKTRIVCNPRGYSRHGFSENENFDNKKIITVEGD